MSSDKGKRRLPVLQSSSDDEHRPAVQWIAIGAVGAVLACLPLVGLVYLWAAKVLASMGGGMQGLQNASPSDRLSLGMIVILGMLGALGVGAMLGGMLVGRYGGDAGKNEGTFAGVAAGLVFAVVSLIGSVQGGQGADWVLGSVVTTILMGMSGRLGAVIGLRLRA